MTPQRVVQFDKVYMNIAKEVASLSYCSKRKVGAIIVRDTQIISQGYNGTPSGRDNCCEIRHYESSNSSILTKSEVIHAEDNAILKCAKYGVSSNGGTLYVTCSPCIECSKAIIQAGIKRVVYDELHDKDGIDLMKSVGIICVSISELEEVISPNEELIKERILLCIEDQFDYFDNRIITFTTTMIDLEFDQFDRAELILKLEKEFGISLSVVDLFSDFDNANTIYDIIIKYL